MDARPDDRLVHTKAKSSNTRDLMIFQGFLIPHRISPELIHLNAKFTANVLDFTSFILFFLSYSFRVFLARHNRSLECTENLQIYVN
jgi:hypothetical protein